MKYVSRKEKVSRRREWATNPMKKHGHIMQGLTNFRLLFAPHFALGEFVQSPKNSSPVLERIRMTGPHEWSGPGTKVKLK